MKPTPPIPRPRKYPVTLDDALRLNLPSLNGRTGERAALYRAALRASITQDRFMASDRQGNPADFAPTDDEVSEVFGKQRREPMEEKTYILWAGEFKQWYRKYKSEIGCKNSQKRWHPQAPRQAAS